MTYEDAYLDGFCKAAEAAGINPVQLYKQASIKYKLLRALVHGKNALGSAKQLGATAAGSVSDAGRAAAGSIADAGRAAAGRVSHAGRRYLELLRGGSDVTNSTVRAAGGRLAGLRGDLGGYYKNELRKALGVQIGTGAAAAGALGAGAYGTAKALQGNPDEAQA